MDIIAIESKVTMAVLGESETNVDTPFDSGWIDDPDWINL